MIKNKILIYPNKNLNLKSKKVKLINLKIKYVIKNMFNIMYINKGIGLASIQIGINLRIITIDISEMQTKPIAFINPKIVNYYGLNLGYEACLSFPGVYVKILRYKYVKVKYINEYGISCYIECKNIFSRCIQHEIDHLNGLTIFNHISNLKKKRIISKICV